MICFADSADQLAHFLMGQVGKLESSIKDNRRILGDGGGQDLHFDLGAGRYRQFESMAVCHRRSMQWYDASF